MFVVPPVQSKYPAANGFSTGTASSGGGGGGGGGTHFEAHNTIQHPTGPEYQLLVGEGIYQLKDDLHIATPPPHPSEAPQPNNNPLATTIGLPTSGTKLSLAIFTPRTLPPQHHFRRPRSNIPHSIQEETQSPKSDVSSLNGNGFGSASYYEAAPGFGDTNPALQPVPPAKGKKDQKLKPKNNIIKSNSSYVSRVIPHDNFQRRLNDHALGDLYAFANVNRTFVWLDLSSEIKSENIAKVLFTKAHPLCHDVNLFTKSPSHLDIIMGFNTSDIIWYEPMTQKYARLNKNGIISTSPIQSILWMPGKENLFIAAHMDGTILVYDKDKEDAPFTPGSEDSTSNTQPPHIAFRVKKSVQSPLQKSNPVAAWKISKMKLNSIAFSPDGALLAAVSEDGTLTIIDYIRERVVDVYRSYYGAMLCVTWSPDGRYVLTGGQDDLVSIWSLADRALVARCVGHESWVTDVKFDPWRCDERNYRFGSVGEDCRLLLWDFAVGMLRRPNLRNRGTSVSTLGPARKESVVSVSRIRSNSSRTQGEGEQGDEEEVQVVHAVDSKASTAVLPPVMSKLADPHPLCWLGFEEDCILTSCKDGTSVCDSCSHFLMA